MAIVPKITRPMPAWAKDAIDHIEYAAGLLAENGMDVQANRLDVTLSVIRRHVRDHQKNAAQGGGEKEDG